MKTESAWLLFALGSAVFGGATAADGEYPFQVALATFYRTLIVLAFIGLIVSARGDWSGFGIFVIALS